MGYICTLTEAGLCALFVEVLFVYLCIVSGSLVRVLVMPFLAFL